MLLLFRLRARQLPDLMRVDSRHATVGLVGPRFELRDRDRRRFMEGGGPAADGPAINQHTPIEWPCDLSGTNDPLAFRTRAER